MNKVSICILIKGDYASTVYSFERSGFAIVPKEVVFINKDAPKEYIKTINGVEVELIVGIKEGCDSRLIDYFKPIASKLIELNYAKNDAMAYNEIFRSCNEKYICIFNTFVFLRDHWLNELIYYNNIIEKQGVVGIPDNFNNVSYLPLLSTDNENFVNVVIPKDNIVNQYSVCLFLREYLFYVGAFDESQSLVGNELNQFQLRCIALGLNNFYIPNQSCLIINKKEQKNKTELNNSIKEMRKNKNYYIPL
jgi:hypothetical protein